METFYDAMNTDGGFLYIAKVSYHLIHTSLDLWIEPINVFINYNRNLLNIF